MLRFPQQITPAIQDYLNAQYALLSDMSERTFKSVQKINELNIQVAQSMMEDSLKNAQQVMTAQDPYEAASIAAAQAQPTAEKFRGYQQELTNIAANTQVELTRSAESHVPNTSRTAAAVADEVARNAKDQTEKVVARQKSAVEKMTNKGGASGGTSQTGANQPGATAGKPQPA